MRQEAIVLADELLLAGKQQKPEQSDKTHDWLDDNGENDWDYWLVYLQDKNNSVWSAILNVANAIDGRKILYDISK